MGREESDMSPINSAVMPWPESNPEISLVVVPEFPQFKGESGFLKLPPET